MKELLAAFVSIALCGTVLGANNGGRNSSDVFGSGVVNMIGSGRGPLLLSGLSPTNAFIETYDDGTDVGLWHCSVGAPRILETSGGNPGAYIQQGGFSTSIPTWASVSTRFQPGVNDQYKIDSIYTGDWTTLGVTRIAVDLNVIQVATWANRSGSHARVAADG